jgi:hypothetical protein
LQRLTLYPTKLTFPCGEFVRSLFNAIFKLAVTLRQFCDHQVNPRRRIKPPGWGISNALAEDELMRHGQGIGTIARRSVNQIPALQL